VISAQEATIMAVGNQLDRPCEGMRLKRIVVCTLLDSCYNYIE